MRAPTAPSADSAESGPVRADLSLWRPLRTPLFRNLLIADVMSDIGTFMQTVGAALAGVIIAVAGVGVAFALNVVSFVGVIVLVLRWKRPVRHRTTPPETLAGATIAALRFVRFSPALRVLMLRAGLTMFCASA